MLNKRPPDRVDVHVGNRVRMARIAANMSQETLAGNLGLTFQQVQKYEKGTNRIAPSRLQIVAEVTHRTVGWFFEGQPNGQDHAGPPKPGAVEIMAATRDGKLLAEVFNTITNARVRHTIVALIVAIAAGEADHPS